MWWWDRKLSDFAYSVHGALRKRSWCFLTLQPLYVRKTEVDVTKGTRLCYWEESSSLKGRKEGRKQASYLRDLGFKIRITHWFKWRRFRLVSSTHALCVPWQFVSVPERHADSPAVTSQLGPPPPTDVRGADRLPPEQGGSEATGAFWAETSSRLNAQIRPRFWLIFSYLL